jgi:hypothetical protein
MPRRIYDASNRVIGSSVGIINLTWSAIGLESKSVAKKNPLCLCGHGQLEYSRLPSAEITSDSDEYFHCNGCDNYTKASDHDELEYLYDDQYQD